MSTAYAAIPTVYAGVRFRSRLEARWACFFDLLEMEWKYEPFDLDGYIPDFLVTLAPLIQAIVEVKPALKVEELGPSLDKIRNSGWDDHMLAVGAGPFHRGDRRTIGYFVNSRDDQGQLALGLCAHCGVFTVASTKEDRIYCLREQHDLPIATVPKILDRLWSVAGNETQWKGGQ